MSWSTPLLVKALKADAAIAPYVAVKPGSDADHVASATAAAVVLGVSNSVGAAAAEDSAEVTMAGIAEITLAATLAAGVEVAANADGHAVAATDGDPTIGRLMHGGVDGDVVPVLLTLGTASVPA